MANKTIGYFEGTDAALLTRLVCEGYDTMPVSNGYDNHGRHVRLINEEKRYDLLIGYLHKVFAPASLEMTDYTNHRDVFQICCTYHVPLMLVVPEELQKRARGLFDAVPDIVYFVDPGDVITAANKILAANE